MGAEPTVPPAPTLPMILSVSRRTDIPAFYSEWLLHRLRQGEVLVRNPMNFHQVGRVVLHPKSISCLVLWSKNPEPLLAHLAEIEGLGYRSVLLFTLTAYGREVETNLPPLDRRIATFRRLARALGQDRVAWRYDPIFFNRRYTLDFHRQAFAGLATALAGATERCIVSFVEMYRKCRRNMAVLAPEEQAREERLLLLQNLADSAATHRITVQSCAASEDLGPAIAPGKCIDGAWLAKRFGIAIPKNKDKHQRGACGCAAAIDIGAYHSCPHGCLYCYANHDPASARRNHAVHDPHSPLLLGRLGEQDVVRDRLPPPPALLSDL